MWLFLLNTAELEKSSQLAREFKTSAFHVPSCNWQAMDLWCNVLCARVFAWIRLSARHFRIVKTEDNVDIECMQ